MRTVAFLERLGSGDVGEFSAALVELNLYLTGRAGCQLLVPTNRRQMGAFTRATPPVENKSSGKNLAI
jgi:hypothetical protein